MMSSKSISAVMGFFKGIVAPASKFFGIYVLEPIYLTAIEYPNGTAASIKLKLESTKHLKKAIVHAYKRTYGIEIDASDVKHISRYIEEQYAIPIRDTEELSFVKTEDRILWSRKGHIPFKGIDLSGESDTNMTKEVVDAINYIASLSGQNRKGDQATAEDVMIRLLAENRDTSLLTYYHSFKTDPERFQHYARKYIQEFYKKRDKGD